MTPSIIHSAAAAVARGVHRLQSGSASAQLARGGIWTMSGFGVSLSASMLAGIAVARLLGPAGFGELAIVRSTLMMLCVFAGANLAPGVSRFVAPARRS